MLGYVFWTAACLPSAGYLTIITFNIQRGFTNEPTKIVAKSKLLSEQKMDKKVPGGLREKSCLFYLCFAHLDLLSSKTCS